MNKKELTEQEVRQRAGFKCENCQKSTMGQYAHIVPDAWGGSYDFQNLLFLCNDCHRKFDVNIFRKGSPEVNSAIRAMNAIRDKGLKQRGLVENDFLFFSNYSQTIVKIGEGITFKSCTNIFTTDDGINLFSINFENNKLIIGGIFYDETDNILLEIEKNKFKAHGEKLWDLKIDNAGDISLQSNDKKISLNITHNDPYLYLTGKLYLGGSYIEANSDGIKINGTGKMKNNTCCGGGGIIFNRYGGFSL